jgi:acetylornithine/succinyldiaminopimelate/putrescine aminotransferase
MKLSKRYTGRTQIIAFKNSYHGSTQGALSIMGDEYWRNSFRPLLPDVLHLNFNSFEDIELISEQTACVILETIQAEAGVIVPKEGWLKALETKCRETGTLLVLDEIQCGFGRNGTLWAFSQFDVVPDILLLGKALGGGMPLGAFISDKKIMDSFTNNPVLGHINTFGGHPVCCAAGHTAMQVLLNEGLIASVREKENLFRLQLVHPKIKNVRSHGLMLAVEFENFQENKKVIDALLKVSGDLKPPGTFPAVFTDWFMFASNCMRIVPPLSISKNEIDIACNIIISVLNNPK